MFKVGDWVIYGGKGVCKVVNIGKLESMSVAKNKGTWTIMSLPFDEYVAAIKRAVEELQRQFVPL